MITVYDMASGQVLKSPDPAQTGISNTQPEPQLQLVDINDVQAPNLRPMPVDMANIDIQDFMNKQP